MMASAVCTKCRKPLTSNANADEPYPYKKCERCREQRRKSYHKISKRLKTEGLCSCGADIADTDVNNSTGQKYKMCTACRKQEACRLTTEEGACNHMAQNARHHSKQMRVRRPDLRGTCTITGKMVRAMYLAQDRKCAISGLPITHLPGDWTASPNRLDNSWDYDDNFHMTAFEFNTSAAHWTKAKLEAVPGLQRELTPEEINARLAWLAEMPLKNPVKAAMDKEGRWLCHWCNDWCTLDHMKGGSRTLCKRCEAKRACATIRVELRKLLNHARHHSKLRKLKGVKKSQNDNSSETQEFMQVDIDLNFLIELLKSQDFRCAYSGIPFEFPCIAGSVDSCEPLYRISLERLNVWKGYIKDNVCLICRGFQSADLTRLRKVAVKGSSGWSKEKVDHVVQQLKLR